MNNEPQHGSIRTSNASTRERPPSLLFKSVTEKPFRGLDTAGSPQRSGASRAARHPHGFDVFCEIISVEQEPQSGGNFTGDVNRQLEWMELHGDGIILIMV